MLNLSNNSGKITTMNIRISQIFTLNFSVTSKVAISSIPYFLLYYFVLFLKTQNTGSNLKIFILLISAHEQ